MTQASSSANRVAGQVVFFAIFAVMALAVIVNLVLREPALFRSHHVLSSDMLTIVRQDQDRRLQRALSVFVLESTTYPENLERLIQVQLLHQDDLNPQLWPKSRRYIRSADNRSYSLK